MKIRTRIFIGIALALSSLPSYANCGANELSFAFVNIKAVKAYYLLSGFAEMELDIDSKITKSGPIKFKCMHWEEAVFYLAEAFNLEAKITNGVIRVRR